MTELRTFCDSRGVETVHTNMFGKRNRTIKYEIIAPLFRVFVLVVVRMQQDQC